MPGTLGPPAHYEPTLESVRRHPVPDWYHDAKLGIFIHWSLSSVPGFAAREHDIGELFRDRPGRDAAALALRGVVSRTRCASRAAPPRSTTARSTGAARTTRSARTYENGLAQWRPELWAERFAAAGARYVVLVTKHHDGFCLWPSRVPHPRKPDWYAPRDVVGELARGGTCARHAVRRLLLGRPRLDASTRAGSRASAT